MLPPDPDSPDSVGSGSRVLDGDLATDAGRDFDSLRADFLGGCGVAGSEGRRTEV